LYFLDITMPDLGVVELIKIAERYGVELPSRQYSDIENSFISYIKNSVEKKATALKLLHAIQTDLKDIKMRNMLMAAIYTLLPTVVPANEHTISLRECAQHLERIGDKKEAMRMYQEYLSARDGYDPVIRINYDNLLELGEQWDEIIRFEGEFLSRSYFRDDPTSQKHYERSFQKLRDAYNKKGIPIPKYLRIAPAKDIGVAIAMLRDGNFLDARTKFAEMIEREDYKQMKAADAIAVLAGYAESIKRSPRVLTKKDWEEVYRVLSLLVSEYKNMDGFDPEYSRDLRAAQRQIEKYK
jgi:hypothetical protein